MDTQKKIPQGLVMTMVIRAAGAIATFFAIFFLTAGTFNYWQAWVYMAIIFIPMLCIVFYFVRRDPDFLVRRLKGKEKEVKQKWIVGLSYLPLIAAFLLPGFDKRYGWSHVELWIVIIADLLVLFGYAIVFFVFRENTFASRIIEVAQGQRVIGTGPYAAVRHPMYLGSLLMYILSPLALGSIWAVLPALFTIPVIIARMLNEEEVLARDLPGYDEYMQKVRYRLLPGIW
jgi:protein-S-isoprenylcysteine O-methyltransferase Ste14